jgi:hypothetical protein
MFDAVSIEHSFAIFMEEPLGHRGGPYDADIFRGGEPAELGMVVEQFAKHLAVRLDRIAFSAEESLNAGAKSRVQVAIARLLRCAEKLKARSKDEREDYHWEIIGDLVLSIAALLDHLEGKGAGER